MKLFKSIDNKIADIGFELIQENEFGIRYKRKKTTETLLDHYVEIIYDKCLMRDPDYPASLHSYYYKKKDNKEYPAPLSCVEATLFAKKMRSLGLCGKC